MIASQSTTEPLSSRSSDCPFAALAALVVGLCAPVARAQAERPAVQLDGAEIQQRLEGLQVVGSVLYVAAHPDDENTRLISWLANGRHVRTGYLSLTRGDGGQNLIGHELGDALGVVRTQELLEARRIDGGEQFFTRAVDFGYSKSPDETFAKWGRQEILGDVVRVIRSFRPDVIVTRFDRDGSGGHGHHTASSLLAAEAFDLAADPQAFPEQLAQGLETWRTRRLYFNGSTWWRADLADVARADPVHWIGLDVGGFDPLLGLSYTELAGRSRSQHKSQGFGSAESRGEAIEYLRLDKGPPLATGDLFDGIDTTWARVPGAENVVAELHTLVDAFEPARPERSVPGLATLARTFDAVAARNGVECRYAARAAGMTRRLILQACGVVFEATSPGARAAAGETVQVSLSALLRRPEAVLGFRSFVAPDGTEVRVDRPLTYNRAVVIEHELALSARTPVDEPYWLAAPHDGLFHPDAARYAGIEPASRSSSSFTAVFTLADGFEMRAECALANKWVDRVAGEQLRPFAVTPVASLRVGDPVALVRGDQVGVTVEVEALCDSLSGRLECQLPEGWSLTEPLPPIDALRRGERRSFTAVVARGAQALAGKLRFACDGPRGRADRTLHTIDHPHILPQNWYSPAEVTLVPLDVHVDVHTVGYVDGAGDEIPDALRRLGVTVERIDPGTARPEDLEACDAIVTGIRAYNTVPALVRFQPRLLEYVEHGGTLLVQYATNGNDLVMSPKAIGPYPFTITRDRVTLEEATPTFLAPAHPLFATPNAITAADFQGWVQERGLYFAGDVDAQYASLIAWNDPGEKVLTGALIVCDHGRGRFVYTGLSLFRQLPAGVPGAYRLLANLIHRRTQRG